MVLCTEETEWLCNQFPGEAGTFLRNDSEFFITLFFRKGVCRALDVSKVAFRGTVPLLASVQLLRTNSVIWKLTWNIDLFLKLERLEVFYALVNCVLFFIRSFAVGKLHMFKKSCYKHLILLIELTWCQFLPRKSFMCTLWFWLPFLIGKAVWELLNSKTVWN